MWYGDSSKLWSGGTSEKKYIEMVWIYERMKSEEFVKEVYVSDSMGSNSRGRSLGRWKERVKEYMCERCY